MILRSHDVHFFAMIIVRFFAAFRKEEPLYVVKKQIEMNKNDISGSSIAFEK